MSQFGVDIIRGVVFSSSASMNERTSWTNRFGWSRATQPPDGSKTSVCSSPVR
jgi:hypothetical protein